MIQKRVTYFSTMSPAGGGRGLESPLIKGVRGLLFSSFEPCPDYTG